MSYLVNALKQSQQSGQGESDHLAYQHQKQLKLYRSLVIGLTGVIVVGGFSLAGFVTGNYVQSGLFKSQPIEADIQAQPEVSANVQEQQQSTQGNVSTPVVAGNVNTQVQQGSASQNMMMPTNANIAPIMTNNAMNTTAVQYQWMTVQVGVDNLGQPVYRQQLVPVTTSQQLPGNVIPMSAPTASLQSFGQNNVVAQQPPEDLSQYRVVGKPLSEPLQQALQEKKQDPELAGVSSELKKAFARAVAETEHSTSNEVTSSSKDSARATPIELLPSDLQSSLPSLRYQAHIYSTEISKRWIKLNNRELYEGDSIGALRVVEITPEQTLFDFDGYEFSMKAMQDWLP